MPNQLTCYRWREDFGGLKIGQVKRLKELEKENERLRKALRLTRPDAGEADPSRGRLGNLHSTIVLEPMAHNGFVPSAAAAVLTASGRSSGVNLGERAPHLSCARAASLDASRKVSRERADEDALTADIVALASQYGRYGYRRITAMLCNAGWVVDAKRVER